jgi:hypothetical protein
MTFFWLMIASGWLLFWGVFLNAFPSLIEPEQKKRGKESARLLFNIDSRKKE